MGWKRVSRIVPYTFQFFRLTPSLPLHRQFWRCAASRKRPRCPSQSGRFCMCIVQTVKIEVILLNFQKWLKRWWLTWDLRNILTNCNGRKVNLTNFRWRCWHDLRVELVLLNDLHLLLSHPPNLCRNTMHTLRWQRWYQRHKTGKQGREGKGETKRELREIETVRYRNTAEEWHSGWENREKEAARAREKERSEMNKEEWETVWDKETKTSR